MFVGHVHALRAARVALRLALVAAVVAVLLSALLAGRVPARHHIAGLSLASSSAPFSSSSPATTTLPSSATTAPATSSASTTVPTANTGEAWGSSWFGWSLALAVLLGMACLEPLVTRRRLLAVRRT